MKNLSEYIKESTIFEKYEESTTYEGLFSKILKMKKDDVIRCLWGVHDGEVDYALSILKISDKKYTFLPIHSFMVAHDMLKDACKELGIRTSWSSITGNAIRLDYEEMTKVLDILPKFFDKYTGKNEVWKFISFEKSECEKYK